ncbi:SHOCT domain-containing protein [Streptomyces montanisoli]|uniref:SHOCT domain-containing protein n=1 Tax=Streptomyces montanisoli TaxID=2798581 RepID=A0A940RVX9_9ACTN|nr:SHOCT domain-containing protein [Streptomyces montanisoli]MBP0456533.1 SHOCT domain-containing protein [Streptomyces montanisoli]
MHDYPLLNVFWTMAELFLCILWFFLLFKVINDIFRSHDMGGWAKAGWVILVILLPLLGVLVYVIARGQSMGRRDVEQARQQEAAVRDYIRDAAGGRPGTADAGAGGAGDAGAGHLAKLSELRDHGVITDEEFRRAKDRLPAA